MKITKLKLQKSKTIGILDAHGKTRFKKIQFQAEAELEDGEDEKAAYNKLSQYIDESISSEGK